MDVSLQEGLIYWLVLISCLAIHEWAHAYSADKLGDNTPRSQGRVTLNPLAHLDPIGSGVIPLIGIFQLLGGFFLIGWGKPVLIDPRNFKHRVRDHLIVTAAGPLSNLILALVGAIIGGVLLGLGVDVIGIVIPWLQINCALLIFNLLPIPPLDGSHFMRYALGMREETYLRLSMYGGIILLVLINIPHFRIVFGTVINGLTMQFVELMRYVAYAVA